MALGELVDDSRDEARGESGVATDPHFASRRVGEKLDLFDALPKFIERGEPVLENSLAIERSWFSESAALKISLIN